MGKHEPMTAKAIANRIKAKGLQKIKYYCEMCKKQCRDDNGFKCHIMSEAHQRQALVVSEDPEKFVSEFSKQFMDGFLYILKARYRTKRVLANTVFQDYIKERDHVHMNGTRWTSLTEFAKWLGENKIVEVEDSERGVLVTYIDKDPETLRRKELEAKRAEQAREAALRAQKEIERQREVTNKIYEQLEREKLQEKSTIDKASIQPEQSGSQEAGTSGKERVCDIKDDETPNQDLEASCKSIQKPVVKLQPLTLKGPASSGYKPPPPKRKVIRKSDQGVKKTRTS